MEQVAIEYNNSSCNYIYIYLLFIFIFRHLFDYYCFLVMSLPTLHKRSAGSFSFLLLLLWIFDLAIQ